jgi:ribosomal protein S18 acetylase RimI-like enzyme
MSRSIIRAPEKQDIDALAALHFYMWNEFYKAYLPQSYSKQFYTLPQCIDIQHEMLEKCRDNPHEHFARILMIDDKLAAIGYIARQTDFSHDLAVPGFDTEFERIYIWPEYRGRGFGSEMMSMGMEWLKENDYKSAFLWAFDLNPYARFYPKHGATIAKRMTRDYVGTPLDLTAYGWSLT